jgi:hypothetical protein
MTVNNTWLMVGWSRLKTTAGGDGGDGDDEEGEKRDER